ncbi:MAG TPA: NUDIX hydrolase [Jatrophihabitantaceae bacterium]|nr:NUDIX hydrolase [Jatrophihabitantaceae bacterium]
MTEAESVPIEDAATVVLLRDGAAGIETWLLTRVRNMAFAGGMTVFPGGRLDDADADLPFAPSADADLEELANRFGTDSVVARRLVGAAVRETFEETGVLLTVPAADLADARSAVEAGTLSFGDLLREHQLAVDGSHLRPWSRWVTPPNQVRRYDTRFFLAALPDGAQPADVTSESTHAGWVSVADAIELARRGERRLLPPTLMTLASLQSFGTVADALTASEDRVLDAVRPTISIDDATGDLTAVLPDGTSLTVPGSMFR